jgi:hypothetical protein
MQLSTIMNPARPAPARRCQRGPAAVAVAVDVLVHLRARLACVCRVQRALVGVTVELFAVIEQRDRLPGGPADSGRPASHRTS